MDLLLGANALRARHGYGDQPSVSGKSSFQSQHFKHFILRNSLAQWLLTLFRSEGNTLDAYKSASSEVSGSSAPEEVVGGTFDAVSEDGDDDDNNNDDNSDDNNDNDNDDSNDDDDNDNAESSGAPSMSSAVESAVSASALESAATAAATGQGAGGEEDTGEDSAAGGLVTPLSLICGAAMGAAALML